MNLALIFWEDGRLFGIEWHVWKIIGWAGNLIFFSRFFVQWIATEKQKRVVVPISFWWLSLVGSVLLLAYGIYQRDSVFIFAYAFTWIPYIRSIIIHYRNKAAQPRCALCGQGAVPRAAYCHHCGAELPEHAGQKTQPVQKFAVTPPLTLRPAPSRPL
jgi:lipid-A-disaccharide synthase-like uncharacterized protein